jgi:hypothetical protein
LDTCSDYTVLIENLPHEDTELVIKKNISNVTKKGKESTVSVIRSFTNFISRVG